MKAGREYQWWKDNGDVWKMGQKRERGGGDQNNSSVRRPHGNLISGNPIKNKNESLETETLQG